MVILPLGLCWRTVTILIRKMRGIFACIRKNRPERVDIPMTIIEERPTVQTIAEVNVEQSEANEDTTNPLLPAQEILPALPTAPKIG